MLPRIGAVIVGLAFSLALSGCDSAEAPSGKWQGVLYDGEWLVTVRLEVDPGNLVRVSAPNLRANFRGMTAQQRAESWTAITRTLDRQFREASAGHVRMSGNEIIRDQGYAPMFALEERGQMKFYFYGDGSLTHEIKLEPVQDFAPLKRPGGL